ncbi:MAG: hypothetical protein P1P74_05040 [Desulfuromonadales bacterium]|nr:hypothetical protein [Desulfuromonadales bacterium]MDT8423426.1 hypothetical protein [Desulfuromonadales bacterium]
MKRINKEQLRDAWILFFILGIIMLNYPFLEIFNKTVQVMGIPLLVAYFFIGWPISILVIFFFSRSLTTKGDKKEKDPLESL